METPPATRLRPLQLSELLDELFRMYRRHFALFIGVSLALTVPSLVTTMLSGEYRAFSVFFAIFGAVSNPGALYVAPEYNGYIYALGLVLAILLAPLSLGAVVQAALDVAEGRPTSVPLAIGRTLRRYFSLAGLLLLFVAGVVLGFVPFTGLYILGISLLTQTSGEAGGLVSILAGFGVTLALVPLYVFLVVRLSVAVPALGAERLGPIRALRRSWSLVRHNWWRLFLVLVVTYALAAAIESALSALLGLVILLVPGLSTDLRSALLVLILTLVGVFSRPIFPIVTTLMYFDLRVRQEGYDLDQLAAALPPPMATPALPPPVVPTS
ncbi:MAG: hypothetical protein QOE92_267 [Chloroflexota bacterium]|nr:hypothetical protein [Chloroflexota bacterium]